MLIIIWSLGIHVTQKSKIGTTVERRRTLFLSHANQEDDFLIMPRWSLGDALTIHWTSNPRRGKLSFPFRCRIDDAWAIDFV